MQYRILACDYDGTLAHDGHVDTPTIAALERLLATGRQLILVTGRHLADLLSIFPQIKLFARVVAENGAVLYDPANRAQTVLAPGPPAAFIEALRKRGIDFDTGEVVVATRRPHETVVHEVIGELKLNWTVILNKDAVMALPAGTNKGSGITAALCELGVPPEQTVGIGDAENDFSLLKACAVGVAVANAIPALKELVDCVTSGEFGAGAVELIDRLIADDLHGIRSRSARR